MKKRGISNAPKHYEVVSSSVRTQKSSDNLGKRGSWWPSSSIWLSKELSIVIKEARLTFSVWVPSTHLSICWTLTMGQVLGYEAEGPRVPLGRTARSTGRSLPSQALSRGTPTNTPTTTHPGFRVSTRKQTDWGPQASGHSTYARTPPSAVLTLRKAEWAVQKPQLLWAFASFFWLLPLD